MTTYIDTAILAKLYCPETDSDKATALVQNWDPPFIFTHLHELELRTALRLKAFRKEITLEVLAEALERLDEDIASGFLRRPSYDFQQVHREAERISAAHAATFGCRTLDILHVAAALSVGATDFVTYDLHQKKLAKETGMHAHP
ncbi:MAG: type II toxin-antitoxin system VapC family toxin [Verrucomicrobiota bacterium]